MFRIEPDVKKATAVGGPGDGARGIRDQIRKLFAGGEIPNVDFIELRSRIVRRPGEQPVVSRMTSLAQMEISLAFGKGVAVEQHLLAAAVGGRNTVDERMLAAFAVLHEIRIASV